MKKVFQLVGVFVALSVVAVVAVVALTPWMDRWGATSDEIVAAFPGDDLVPAPASFVNRAVTIQAAPEKIYPWLVQMGAERGGLYSYSWFETNILRCELINADRIHEEWQGLKVGDIVKMCPGEESGPPPAYEVALIEPNKSLVMGHKENGKWVNLWQFIIKPQMDGSSRLILRTRTMAVGGFWDVIHPGVFIMERGLLLGVKERAERLAISSIK